MGVISKKSTSSAQSDAAIHKSGNMLDAKVVKQLQLMDGRERQRFKQFVDSPYFNQHPLSIKLLHLLLKGLATAKPKLSKEKIFKQLFPLEDFQEQALADQLSALMKLVNQFLAVEQLKEEPFLIDLLTLRRTEVLNRFELLDNRRKRLKRILETSPHQGSDHHWVYYRLYVIYGYYRNAFVDRSDATPLQEMMHGLDRYYILEKLKHACHLTANSILMNTRFDFGLLDQLLLYMQTEQGQQLIADDRSIDCYYHILMSLRAPEEQQHYARMRYYLNEAFESFPHSEQRDIFAFANNYCITRIMKGDPDYRRELLELYQRGLNTKIIFDKGIISEWDYKNIVTLGCDLKAYEWTAQFIEDNYAYLPENRRNNAYALNKAQYFYARGLYQEAGELLRQVADSDVKYHLARVLLEVRIAYDQKETNYLLNQLDTFRLYVRRHRKINTSDKRKYINYTRFAKQLTILRHQEAFMSRKELTQKLESLHQKINTTPQLVGRDWLLQESKPAVKNNTN